MMSLAETKLATAQSAELSETWCFNQRAIWSSIQLGVIIDDLTASGYVGSIDRETPACHIPRRSLATGRVSDRALDGRLFDDRGEKLPL